MFGRLRPSPAMLVAIAATVLALGGTAVAALSGSEKKQVRKIVKKIAYPKSQTWARAEAYSKAQASDQFVEDAALGSKFPSTQGSSSTLIVDFNVGSFTGILTHSISVPGAGKLLVWGNATFEHDSSGGANSTPVSTRLTLDSTQIGTVQQAFIEATSGYSDSTALTAVVPVTAGSHDLQLQAINDESGWIAIEDRSISTLFIPA